MTTFSAREFNQQVSKARKAALEEPVFITERGKPRHVLPMTVPRIEARPLRPALDDEQGLPLHEAAIRGTSEVGGAVTILRAAARSGAHAVHAGSVGAGPNGDLVREALAADGIALTTNYVDKYPGDEAFAPVFDELDRRKAVVYFHPTAASFAFNVIPNIPPPSIEFPFDTTRAITSLLFGGTFHRCPNIKWIFSHGGGALGMVAHRLVGLAKNRPELNARVPNGVMYELSRLYVDVVGVTTPGALRAVLDIVPMSHLLFGSDFPFWDPDVTVKGLAGLKLSAADLQAIERDNALKLLPNLPH